MVQMHRGLGHARGAGGVQPKSHVVRRKQHRLQGNGGGGHQFIERGFSGHLPIGDYDVLEEGQPGFEGFDHRPERLVHDQYAGAAVVEEIFIIAGLEQGVDRHRHGAEANGAPETRGEIQGVQHQHHHPVFRFHPQPRQGISGPVGPRVQIAIGHGVAAAKHVGAFALLTGKVGEDQMIRDVELLGQIEGTHYFGLMFGRRWIQPR